MGQVLTVCPRDNAYWNPYGLAPVGPIIHHCMTKKEIHRNLTSHCFMLIPLFTNIYIYVCVLVCHISNLKETQLGKCALYWSSTVYMHSFAILKHCEAALTILIRWQHWPPSTCGRHSSVIHPLVLGELDNSPTWKHWSNPKKNPSTNHKTINMFPNKILDFPAHPCDLTKARAFELRTLGREKTRDRFWRGSPVDEWPKAHDMGGMVLLLPQLKLHH